MPGRPCSNPESRALSPGSTSGIVLLDKPKGLSSNAALQKVKRATGARKAGHAGTLDPLATGMLPILLGEATKIAAALLHQDKAYRVLCRLGQSTDTYDAEGEITAQRPVPDLDAERLRPLLARFTGRIRQQAPAYSAIKQDGQPLYRRVRRGEAVQAPVREVDIRCIEIESLSGVELGLRVECGSGTYIRSLAHDLGEVLGCGAHVQALRRLWVEPFRDQPMLSLDQVLAGELRVVPALAGLAGWPRVVLSEVEHAHLRQGRAPERSGLAPGPLAAVAPDGRLAGLLDAGIDGRLRIQRVLLAEDEASGRS